MFSSQPLVRAIKYCEAQWLLIMTKKFKLID